MFQNMGEDFEVWYTVEHGARQATFARRDDGAYKNPGVQAIFKAFMAGVQYFSDYQEAFVKALDEAPKEIEDTVLGGRPSV